MRALRALFLSRFLAILCLPFPLSLHSLTKFLEFIVEQKKGETPPAILDTLLELYLKPQVVGVTFLGGHLSVSGGHFCVLQ